MKYPFNYLIYISFLGFRYHGWQYQVGIKTIQGMVDKTFKCILGHERFKTLGASRTDAMVSASEFAFQLFLKEDISNEKLLEELDLNLPPDISVIKISKVSDEFNIIRDSKVKEYNYHFSHGKRFRPFHAPFAIYIRESLDVELMKKGAKLFVGEHDFRCYAYKSNESTIFKREILTSELLSNDNSSQTFYPEDSFVYKVRGKGFLRHQVKYMIGTLIDLGLGKIFLKDIENSLSGKVNNPIGHIAPSSGLLLKSIEFDL